MGPAADTEAVQEHQPRFRKALQYNNPDLALASHCKLEINLDDLVNDPDGDGSKFVRGLCEELKIELLEIMKIKIIARQKQSNIIRVH